MKTKETPPPPLAQSAPTAQRPSQRGKKKPKGWPNGKHPGGRPTVLTKDVNDKILSFLRLGAYVETAVSAAGVAKDTFYRWLKEGARLKRDHDAGRLKRKA